MISLKLRFLARWFHQRADSGEPLRSEEISHIADTLEALVPHVEALESRPLPPSLRIIPGGKDGAA